MLPLLPIFVSKEKKKYKVEGKSKEIVVDAPYFKLMDVMLRELSTEQQVSTYYFASRLRTVLTLYSF